MRLVGFKPRCKDKGRENILGKQKETDNPRCSGSPGSVLLGLLHSHLCISCELETE